MNIKRGNSTEKDFEQLAKIKNLKGFALCWGHAKAVIEGELDLIDKLEDYFLKILPGFVPHTPQAKLSQNQPIVEYLSQRSNKYKRISNPKYFAYDRVVEIVSNTEIPVTAENCKNFKGVGPKIAQHIKKFLSAGNSASSGQYRKRFKYKMSINEFHHVKTFFKRPRYKNLCGLRNNN